ncbi:hypothetical protein [Candidatus Protofrankia californiensis]|uniref:hypothetical protein n=1 Tax=Candidatus Protofrankia californiensis TaxID=1839754 RepID=UPI0013ED6449
MEFDREFVDLWRQRAMADGQGVYSGLRAFREIVQGALVCTHLGAFVLNRTKGVFLPLPGAHQVLAGVRGLPFGVFQASKKLIELFQSYCQFCNKIITDRIHRLCHRTASPSSWI